MAAAGEAISASAANDVAFTADDFADVEIGDIGADFDDFADELVSDGHGDGDGFLRPLVPLVDMNICPANAGAEDFDEDVVDAEFWDGDLIEPEAWFGFFFDECVHRGHLGAELLG